MGAGRGRRTGIILILLVIIILVVGIGVLFLLQGSLGGTTASSEPTPAPPTPPPTVNVIIASRDIPRGARLGVQDVTIMAWPILADAPPPLGALTLTGEEGSAGLEQVDGRIARVDILNGQPVLDFMLTPGTEPAGIGDAGSDAALLIPAGQVAYAIPIDRFSSVAYAVREGDHVDLMMSFRFVDVDEDFQTILPNEGLLITDQPDLLAAGLQSFQYDLGREEDGPFGTTLLVLPTTNDESEPRQRPRQATQMVIDNAMVLRVGTWPLAGLNEPIVVTPAPPPTAVPDSQGGEGEAPPPTATPIPVPDVVTMTMSRQDALVLKYALETGAKIDLVLRSALDDDINDIVTDTVTLQYIIDFYNVAIPPKLPIAQDPRIDLGPDNSLPGFGGATPVAP